MTREQLGTRAIVIGAGMAGLVAARVLADRYPQVRVLDRDQLPERPEPRRGVPQSAHGHVLLVAGQRALEQLLPGLEQQLVAAGATAFDTGLDLRFHRYGAVYPRIATGLRLVSMSRPLLESTVRERVRALPGVTLTADTAVAGLAGDRQRITGVRLADGIELAADLVVDCSGRGTRSDRWLAELGLPAPRVEEVGVGVGYATRLLRRRPGDLPVGAGVFVLPTPPRERRVGLAVPVEGDRWLVSLGGWHGARAGTDDAGFLAYARELPEPTIAGLLERAEPLGPVTTISFPASRRRRFELLREVPGGYLTLGDAFCSVNPVYGQGMTCAVLSAVELGTVLDRYRDTTPATIRRYYRAAARVVATPWRFAVGGDFGYPQTTGRAPRGITLLNRYARRVQLVARHDVEVRRVFTGIQQLVVPPAALFAPGMLIRVLRAGAARRRAAE